MKDQAVLSMILSQSALFGGSAKSLSVGDPAPNFTLYGADGEVYKLEHYKGKQGVVLAWFPRAFTPG